MLENLRKDYFSMQGRIGRWQFFMGHVKLFFASTIISMAVGFVLGPMLPVSAVLINLIELLAFIASCSLAFRRFHDHNRSGWWIVSFALAHFIFFCAFILFLVSCGVAVAKLTVDGVSVAIPAMGVAGLGAITLLAALLPFIIDIYLLFMRGTKGDNQYGPDPVGPKQEAEATEPAATEVEAEVVAEEPKAEEPAADEAEAEVVAEEPKAEATTEETKPEEPKKEA